VATHVGSIGSESGTRFHMLIGNEWPEAFSGETFERRSPVDGHLVGSYPNGDARDADRAVKVARQIFDAGTWATGPSKERVAILRRTADLLRANIEPLSRMIVEEVGRPIKLARVEVLGAADVFDYNAGLALDLHGDAVTQQVPDAVGLIVHEPVGVVAMMMPWNFPLNLLSWKLGPALAVGCTVVCKPSHHTSGSTLMLGRLFLEAGLPPGVINVVTSERDNGAVVGKALAEHPLVDKVAFTGSTATGRKVLHATADTFKRVSLELGGKSPNVVFADAASLDDAVEGAFFGIYRNSGQVCVAGSRLLVQDSIKDAFIEKLVHLTKTGIRLGDPFDPSTNMGPVISEQQLDKVLHYVDTGKSEGAQLLVGGERARSGALAQGFYVQPTIFDRVTNEMTIAREEIFGPVLSVLTFKDAEDALRMANDTLYGLGAAIWTRDIDKAFTFAKRVKAGTVWVNAYHGIGLWGMPYGGYKQSGVGRELGHEGLKEYMETKSIHIKLNGPVRWPDK
jgi:acyl-CoA reductase-like NAD-dependent aldehyde dehydrogenase